MKGSTARFWFSENSQAFSDWLNARNQIMEKNPLQLASDKAQLQNQAKIYAGDREDELPSFGDGSQDYMMQRHGNLALIQISGTLVKNDSYWNRYYGIVSYDEIRRSVVMALEDPEVDGIMAVMSTPGGSAAGADAMASFFTKANQLKPFYSFAETDMCSGGYYLAAPSKQIYSQRAAMSGSIGVIMVHMDILDMYQENGIKPTVFRAGEFKALGSPYEHLDDRAKASINKTLGGYFDMFNQHVVDNRGFSSVPDLLAKAGEGRVFLGAEAKEVGLVDQVLEFEEALEDASSRAKSSSGKITQFTINTSQILRGSTMSKARAAAAAGANLTAEQIAALAAGASLDTEASTEAAAGGSEGGETEVEAEAEAEAGGEPSAEAEATKPDDVAEPGAEVKTQTSDSATLDRVIALSTENGQLKSDLTASRAELDKANQKNEQQATTMSGLQAIVCQAISHRQVALGFQPSDATSMSAENQIELFTKLDTDFKSRFVTGAQSKPSQAAVLPVTNSPAANAAKGMTGKL